MRPLAAILVCAAVIAGEHGQVIAVLGPDRLAIQYYQLPVVVRLAEVQIPAETADQAQARLTEVVGKKSNVAWSQDLGADDAGTPRVQVSIGSETKTLNEALIESGFARFAPTAEGGRLRERLAAAEAKAKKAKLGLWAGDAAATAAPAAPTGPAAPVAAKGRFAAELDGRHYYPADAPEIAKLNPKRTVWYASEDAARKAGKQAWQQPSAAAPASLEEARASFARGRELVTQAAGQGPSAERDKLYERAFLELSGAMQAFTRLAEAKPNDEELAEELRACMQMRYAAMKSKRYH